MAAACSTPPAECRCRGEYAVGWIKRGPSGVIGTNKKDAQETVDAILADARRRNGGGLNVPTRAEGAERSSDCCANASPSSSPTPAGLRSIATSVRSASPPAGRA